MNLRRYTVYDTIDGHRCFCNLILSQDLGPLNFDHLRGLSSFSVHSLLISRVVSVMILKHGIYMKYVYIRRILREDVHIR